MYDRFVNEVIVGLLGKIDSKDLNTVKEELYKVASKYSIKLAKNEVIVYTGLPYEVKAYLAVKLTEGASEGTVKSYSDILVKFFNTVGLQTKDVDTMTIRKYLYVYKGNNNISNRTLNHIRSVIATFFRWCLAEGYIDKDPAASINKIKCEIKQRGYLTEVELEKLRNACKNNREKAMIEFFYSTGCRVSELVNAKLDDIDWVNQELKIKGKGNKWRTVYLNAKCTVALTDYLKSRKDTEPYIFISSRAPYRQTTKNGVEGTIKVIGERSNIDKNIYPHMIRHTTATLAIKRGMPIQDVQRILGHSNIDTTMVYTTVTDAQVKSSHSKAVF